MIENFLYVCTCAFYLNINRKKKLSKHNKNNNANFHQNSNLIQFLFMKNITGFFNFRNLFFLYFVYHPTRVYMLENNKHSNYTQLHSIHTYIYNIVNRGVVSDDSDKNRTCNL